jgi:RNA polymerase sigma-70 factor (ECF subfamily)
MVGTKNDEASLVARVRSGDEAAWSEIVELHWRRVWSVSRIIVRDRQGAEDLTQGTFRAARERLSDDRGGDTLRVWIQAICRELARNELRRRGRRSDAAAVDPQAQYAELELALEALDVEDREALLLTEAGSTPEDLAAALGVPPATIRSRTGRARARLLEELGEAVT